MDLPLPAGPSIAIIILFFREGFDRELMLLREQASLGAGHAEAAASSVDPKRLQDLIAFAEGAVGPQPAKAPGPQV